MENILSENHTSEWTIVFCGDKQHWTCVTSMRKKHIGNFYNASLHQHGGYTKLSMHRDLRLTILKLQEKFSNHDPSASCDSETICC